MQKKTGFLGLPRKTGMLRYALTAAALTMIFLGAGPARVEAAGQLITSNTNISALNPNNAPFTIRGNVTITATGQTFDGSAVTLGKGLGFFNIEAGSTLTINGGTFRGCKSSVVCVEDNTNLNMNNTTVTGSVLQEGSAGAAVANVKEGCAGSTISLSGCTFSQNTPVSLTDGVSDGGVVRMNPGSGSATLNVENCAFSDNKSQTSGGVITVADTAMTLRNCSFTDNTLPVGSAVSGGAIFYVDRVDHGDMNPVKIIGCTFSGNSAPLEGGAIRYHNNLPATGQKGELTIQDTTITDNTAQFGGGIYAEGNVLVTISGDTHINRNTATINNRDIIEQCAGGVLIVGGTLKANDTEFSGNAAEIGGAVMLTGSTDRPAMGTFTNCIFNANSTDKRGGAVYVDEYASGELNGCTISKNTANVSGGAIYAGSESGAGVLSLQGCTVKENSANSGGNGGAIFVADAATTIKDSTFTGNNATGEIQGDGGVLFFNDRDQGGVNPLVISGCTMTGNSGGSEGSGGAIRYLSSISAAGQKGSFTITDTTMEKNTGLYGGALYADGNMLVTINGNSHFNDNKAGLSGGAICIDDGQLNMTGTAFSGNTASINGGAVATGRGGSAGELTGVNCMMTANTAIQNAGAIYISVRSKAELTGGSLKENTTSGMGGGIRSDGTVVINGAEISDNYAGIHGGGIYNDDVDSAVLTLKGNTTIEGNACKSEFGGGLFAGAAGRVEVQGTPKIHNNYMNVTALHTGAETTYTFAKGTETSNVNNAYLDYQSSESNMKLIVEGDLQPGSMIGMTSASPVSGRILVVPDGTKVTKLPSSALAYFSHDALANGTSAFIIDEDGTAANSFILNDAPAVSFNIPGGADHEIIPLLYGGVTKKQLDFSLKIGGTVVPATDSRRNDVSFTTELIGGFKNRTAAEVATIANGGMATAGYSGIVKVTAHYKNASSENHVYLVVPGDLDKSGDIELNDAVQMAAIVRDESVVNTFDVMDGSVKISGMYLANMNNIPGVDVDDIVKVVYMLRGASDYYNGPMH